MSEPKLISPLLDNFLMGDPISEHYGIRCCPAMEKDSSRKYIVKIISMPSSETQLNALLLTGALKDNTDAQKYFEDRGNDLIKEIELLQQLSRQEGFIAFDGFQAVHTEDAVGIDLYILSQYKRSLERQFTKKAFTHLDALNLGLDMCSALTACRRSGHLFINLKPSNIYVTQNGEYKISDLGFVNLKSLKYATIPEHYIGSFTPPELLETFSTLNDTVDVYALGMILYMIYNGGTLPETSVAEIAAPKYADDELSEIILKACSQKPEDRWQDPAQMGQMLVNYMQKNGASNEPIIPPEEPKIPENNQDTTAETTQADDMTTEEAQAEADNNIQNAESDLPPADEILDTQVMEDQPVEDYTDDTQSNQSEADVAEVIYVQEQIDMDMTENHDQDISYDELTDEVSQMLSQADELASMEVPEPVIAPDPVEIVLPISEEEVAEETDKDSCEDNKEAEVETQGESSEEFDEIDTGDESTPKRSHWLRNTLLILAGLCALIGGFLFYKFYFMQTIDDLQLIGNKNTLSVSLQTKTDESLLTISCTDLYGKTIIVPVVNGKAEFSGLIANAEYTIAVNVKGFHALTGKTSAKYFTPTETSIVQYSVVTGTLPGTAILSFTVSGPDSQNWRFTYGTSNSNKKDVSFTGHTVTLSDLEENKVYTGILEPEDDLFIAQTTEISFTASEVIQASNLMITSCADGKLTAKWSVPETIEVEGWNVRCYNGEDYDQTIKTTDTSVEFTALDQTDSFTVEVTAVGQSFVQTATIGANSVTVSKILADTSIAGVIALQWDASNIPEGGWIISYTVNGSETVMSVTSTENRVVIKPAVPGAQYVISIRAADSTPTVCEPCICITPEAEDFTVNYSGNVVTKNNLRFYLCKRPMLNVWSHNDLSESDYRTSFRVGENAGYVIFLNRMYDVSYDTITTAFVIQDENGQIISISSTERTWTDMWYKNYCELDIPSLPDTAGNYTISVYFNGQFAVKQAFNIIEE